MSCNRSRSAIICAKARLDDPVFPDAIGGFRDPANVRRDIRDARGDDALAWITSHNFRKTATVLDGAGLTAREIADQLGQARPSMTQDVYMGRKVRSTRAAEPWRTPFASRLRMKSAGKVRVRLGSRT